MRICPLSIAKVSFRYFRSHLMIRVNGRNEHTVTSASPQIRWSASRCIHKVSTRSMPINFVLTGTYIFPDRSSDRDRVATGEKTLILLVTDRTVDLTLPTLARIDVIAKKSITTLGLFALACSSLGQFYCRHSDVPLRRIYFVKEINMAQMFT